MVTISALAKVAVLATAALLAPPAGSGPRKLVVGYLPNWGDTDAFIATFPFEKLTHLNLAFENPTDADGTMSFDAKSDKIIAKAHEKGVKVLVSIGGGGASDDAVLKPRYFDLISAPKRVAFAQKLADYTVTHNFDGLDVDMEGPSINADYGPFIDELSKAMRAKGKLLTAALSQGYGGDMVPNSVFDKFDFVNVMAYDATGTWDKDRPGQHSSYEYAKSNIKFWTDRGLPKSKAVLGVPFYGYGFGDAYNTGGYEYKTIVATYPGAEKLDEVGKTIWYNGIPTITAKCKYVLDEDLGGIMIWSIDQDATGENSLLTAIDKALRP